MGQTLLERARAGDEQAFGELTAPHLRELQLHCYRMLGSLVDAEDQLQETLIAAWRGLDGFAGRSSLRAWLYRIATNRCLNAMRTAKRRRPPEPVPPFDPPPPSRLAEATWLQPLPDDWLQAGPDEQYVARETVELAFVAALQRLPPRQTAVLLLHDVLGYATAEIAQMMDTTTTAIKGALQRARAAAGKPPPSRGDSASEREIARRFAAAFTTHDIDGIVELLTDDAWLAMPPAPHEYLGPAAVAAFLRVSAEWRADRATVLVPTLANGQPAFGCYLTDPGETTALATGVLVLTVSGGRISGITRFLDPDLPRRFGLAEKIG